MPQNAIEKVVAAKEGAVKVWSTAKKNPTRTMKVLSCVSGLLLVVGGFSGFFNFNPLKAVISLYNMCAAFRRFNFARYSHFPSSQGVWNPDPGD